MQQKDFFRFHGLSEYENDPNFFTRANEAVERSCDLIAIIINRLIANFIIVGMSLMAGFLMLAYAVLSVKDPVLESPELRSVIYGILGALSTAFLSYIGLVITVYWNLDSVYGRKWTLITEKFYDLDRLENKFIREHSLTNLWIEALHIKVWADPGLNFLIYEGIEEALLVITGEKGKDERSTTDEAMQFLELGFFNKETAIWILSEYLEVLNYEILREQKQSKKFNSRKLPRVPPRKHYLYRRQPKAS